MKKVIFEFPNDETAQDFLSWLASEGESAYWEYMRAQGPVRVSFLESDAKTDEGFDTVVKTYLIEDSGAW